MLLIKTEYGFSAHLLRNLSVLTVSPVSHLWTRFLLDERNQPSDIIEIRGCVWLLGFQHFVHVLQQVSPLFRLIGLRESFSLVGKRLLGRVGSIGSPMIWRQYHA